MEKMKLAIDKISKLQCLGRGACATVYRYDDNFVIKIFNEKGLELHDEESFSALVGVKNETCVFPKSLVEVDGNFQGYAMQYIEGTELHNVARKLDFSKIIEAIQKVEEDLKTLASDKILFQDLNQGGIMWSNEEKIKIIDTDFFQKKEDITEEQVYSHNIESFNTMIEMELGILMGQSNSVTDFLQSNIEYNQLYMNYMLSSLKGSNMSVTELLNKAMGIFEQEFGVIPSSIAEMEAILNEKNLFKSEETKVDSPIFEAPIEVNEQETFVDKIFKDMPPNLTQVEKARYIYIQLGKYFSYDEQYIISNSEKEKREIFDRDIEDIVNDKVVCTSLSRIYENLLNSIGINAKTRLVKGERLGHAYTEIELDGEKYKADLIHDLMHIKTGFKTKHFMPIDEKNLSYSHIQEETLKEIDDKIGYTYMRYVYGRIYGKVKRRNESFR